MRPEASPRPPALPRTPSRSPVTILNGAWTQTDPNLYAVGRNDGFALGDARIEITGRPTDSVWLYLSIDGATPVVGSDPTQGTRIVTLKDAYGVWAAGGHLRVQAGQFKAPQDLEELLEETELKFVSRSIVSTGVDAPFGYKAYGLASRRRHRPRRDEPGRPHRSDRADERQRREPVLE